MADEKYTNILGTPFKGYVKEIIRTRAISAGGYNIQEYHYRYLIKVKKVS